MLKSMTGYGLATIERETYSLTIEIKTLNSKFLDLSIRSPRQFSDREIEIRNLVSGILERGKVNLAIDFQNKTGEKLPVAIDEELFLSFVHKFKALAQKAELPDSDVFKLALQSPNVMSSGPENEENQVDWEDVKGVLLEALERCDQFRKDEGKVLQEKLVENLDIIHAGLVLIKNEDPVRKGRIRERIQGNFKEWLEEHAFDKNRFEQELIYYFEKIDITEELVRLETHLDYFRKNLLEGNSQGKKLGFISQEIGREINTIGSKANDAGIQKNVVIMKDELEKIKEQMLNII
jgi:uncharacterized protein (TIGR00255 family)